MARVHLAPLPRNRGAVAPYVATEGMRMVPPKLFVGRSERVKARNRYCRGINERYETVNKALAAAQALIDCTIWTVGGVSVRKCVSCRGFHILMRGA